MMLKIHIIRHGKTSGNENGRYIGSTDEPLSPAGISELKKTMSLGVYPACDTVYSSPMLRCLQTADILYPDKPRVIIPTLAEYHFGLFEGKNYDELNGTHDYQTFIDSGGKSPIPGAPPIEEYWADCALAFRDILEKAKATIEKGSIAKDILVKNVIAIICHGGTIMAIMRYLYPQRDPYDFRPRNGEGYSLDYNCETEEFRSIDIIRTT